MSRPAKHLSLQVQDQEGTPCTVRLEVAEQDESGTLSILTPTGAMAQQFQLTYLKKANDGTRLTCHVRGATATLSLEGDTGPPALHVTASWFVTIFDDVYPLERAEYQRVIEWIKGLAISKLA
jgi:hypothetical protein